MLTGYRPEEKAPPDHFVQRVDEQVGVVKHIAWLFGLLLSSSLLLGLASRWGDPLWLEICITGIDAIIISAFVWRNHQSIFPLLRLPDTTRRESGKLLGFSLLFLLALAVYFSLFEALGVPTMRISTDYVQHGWSIGSMLALVSLAPAVFEELAFRGVIQTRLEQLLSPRDAWIIQAALFSVLHLSPLIFPSHFVMGLYFGWLRRRTSSLYPGMVLHATWNALALFQELY